MALIYIDGFDGYPTADLPKRWTNTGRNDWSIASTSGRNGTGCLFLTSSGFNYAIQRSLGGSRSSIVLGIAVKTYSAFASGTGSAIFTLYDSGSPHLVVKVDAIGNIYLYSGSTLIGSYGAGIIAGAWYYYEIKATISTSIAAGSCVVRVNGVAVITPAAGANLRQGGSSNNSVDRLSLGTDSSSGCNMGYDDLYLFDQTGTRNNDLIGDNRVELIRPTGAGTSTQLTAVGAASNWAAVSEASEDGDTSYVVSSTVGQIDTYATANLSSTPATVYGIQLAITARKDDAGTRTLSGAIRSGGTTYDHGSTNALGLGDNYTTLIDAWETDPNGGISWTGTSINALESGVKLTG